MGSTIRHRNRIGGRPTRSILRSVSAGAICLAMALAPGFSTASAEAGSAGDRIIERLQVVDCLLPGKVRQLGRNMRFLDRRRPARLSAGECEVRGGEYTVYDRAEAGESFNIWMPLAMNGDANAQLIVGELSERGAGGTADFGMARLWYERAADQGNAAAMFNLARIYEQGLGVTPDEEQAARWYRQAYGLNANRLEDAVRIERMEGEIRELTSTVGTLEAELEQALAEKRTLEEQLREKEAELDAAASEIAAITRSLADARRQSAIAAAAYEAKLDELQSRQDDLAVTETEVATRDSAVAEGLEALTRRQADVSARLMAQLANLPSLAAQSTRLAALQSQLESAQARSRALEAERANALAAKRAAVQDAAASRETLQARLETLVARESQLAERESALAETLASLDRSGSDASAQLRDRSAAIAAEQAELARERTAVRAHLDALARARNAQSAREAALADAQAAVEAQRVALAERELELVDARRAVAEEAKALQRGDAAQQAALAGLEAEFDTIASSQAELEQERRQLADLRDELATASVEIALAENQLDARTDEIAQRTAELDAREQAAVTRETEMASLRADAQEARQKLAALEAIISGNTRSMDVATARGSLDPVPAKQEWDIDFGTFHAILIGNANYDDPDWQDLDTPHNDVSRIDEILREQYGFKTTVIIDGTREDILSSIEQAGQSLGKNDNLLIYYAGHGKYSDDAKIGFWEPVDSIAYGYRNSISAQEINFYLSSIDIRKVLVVSDSCYSGAFARDLVERLDPRAEDTKQERFYMIQAAKRSRVVMTAGGLKPVADGVGNGHSLFASAFINALVDNEDIALSRNLFARIRDTVIRSAAQVNLDQEPSFADLVHTGHEGGDFIFVPRI